jgi:hypothetical protein
MYRMENLTWSLLRNHMQNVILLCRFWPLFYEIEGFFLGIHVKYWDFLLFWPSGSTEFQVIGGVVETD